MAVTAASVRTWLLDNTGVDEDIADDTLIVSTAELDSFELVELVAWLESEGGISFGPLDVNLENLDSIERMVAFVASRQ